MSGFNCQVYSRGSFWGLSAVSVATKTPECWSLKAVSSIVTAHKRIVILFLAQRKLLYFPALVKLGYRVLLAEYPGYGGRKGTPSEEVFVADASHYHSTNSSTPQKSSLCLG